MPHPPGEVRGAAVTGGRRVAMADAPKDPKADPLAFMGEMVAATNDAWARVGVSGVAIVKAEWRRDDGYVFLETIPGAEALTVKRVGAFLRAEQAQVAKRTADGMGKLL